MAPDATSLDIAEAQFFGVKQREWLMLKEKAASVRNRGNEAVRQEYRRAVEKNT